MGTGLVRQEVGCRVSTLVLMDSWINGSNIKLQKIVTDRFNPCFNGFMDKWLLNGTQLHLSR